MVSHETSLDTIRHFAKILQINQGEKCPKNKENPLRRGGMKRIIQSCAVAAG